MGKTEKRILIMAGGTGGHIFPALAVADELKTAGMVLRWLGTPTGLETKLVPQAGIPIDYISIGGLRRTGIMNLLSAPFRLLRAFWQALRIVHRYQPHVVLGMGGFASGPGGLAAKLLHKPIVIHEQNAIAGFTNRKLAHFASRVLQAYEHTFPAKYHPIAIGNPVRKNLLEFTEPAIRMANQPQALRILVIGGSQGAHAINEFLPQVLKHLPTTIKFSIKHQTGSTDYQACKKIYAELKIDAEVYEFIEDMNAAYQWANLLICRAGALTVAEITAVGIASILIPFPYAVDDHQTYNAAPLAATGAAIIIQQSQLTIEHIVPLLSELHQHPEKLITMAMAAWQLRKIHAAKQVAANCLEVCRNE